MSAFTYEINKDGIAILTFDLPGEKVNKLTTPVMDELDRLLDELARKQRYQGAGRSGAARTATSSSAPISPRSGTSPTRDRRSSLRAEGQAVLAKLEALPFPTVAAIHGPCMGGGLELALACTYRVISNDQRTALALPEVKLGIIPGFGGTQRLPRLVGLSNALDMILTGKSVYARKAKKIGLADEVTYKETCSQRALATAKKAIGKPRPAKIRAQRPLAHQAARRQSAHQTAHLSARREKNVLQETRGNYPAPLAALDAVRYGLAHGHGSRLQTRSPAARHARAHRGLEEPDLRLLPERDC